MYISKLWLVFFGMKITTSFHEIFLNIGSFHNKIFLTYLLLVYLLLNINKKQKQISKRGN